MLYLKKIAPYNLRDKLKLFQYTLGSILINRVSKQLKGVYHLTNKLLERNIGFEMKKGELKVFCPINGIVQTISLKTDSSDPMVFKQIMLDKEYEPIVDLIRSKGIIVKNLVDAGANVGLTTFYMKAFFPDAKVIALEPSLQTYQRFNNNIDLNSLTNVTSLQMGLWNKKTFLKPDLNFRDKLDWSFSLTENEISDKDGIAVLSMFDIIEEYDLGLIDLLKIDIEGGETMVFANRVDVSWLNKVRMIAIEIHDELNCRTKIESTLIQFNFELFYFGELTVGVNKSLIT